MNKAWMYVFLTCLFELFWVFGFNVATTWWHWGIVVIIILIDFYFLSKACEYLPTGTVYAIFAAAGTVGTALMDVFIFGGAFSIMKGVFMGILITGVVSLKLADNKGEEQDTKGVA
ncbi:DMT family transporter [Natribacillus halophilus]|uniref:Paired small multidrug resistance pump n=1 Tax=Natribacillus halophilus TaxID=549003 RepID=A0A1G8QN18_9BACI|nr:SMR family transporter [Natribacillus halophilus]SDJ06043.1 paired small multidrug resistance pump [Natribacillus halophilus]